MPIFLSCVLLQDPFKFSLSGKVSSICSCYRKPPWAGWMLCGLGILHDPKMGCGCGQGSCRISKVTSGSLSSQNKDDLKSKLTKYLTCWIVWMFGFFPMYVCSTCCYFAMGQSTSVRRPAVVALWNSIWMPYVVWQVESQLLILGLNSSHLKNREYL